MIYTYRCYDCDYQFDENQSVKDKPLRKCPCCKHLSIERVIYAPMVFCKREATTIGQLADRNSKKLGRQEVLERDAKKKEQSAKPLAGARKEINRKISKMTEDQKQRYIENG